MVSLPTFLSLISFLLLSSQTLSKPTKLTLTFTNPNLKNSDTIQNIISLAQSTISRAKHLKSPNPKPTHKLKPKPESRTPLAPRGYGGYSVSLSFGSPPQKSELVFDTGSSLVWIPCTSRYLCSDCDFPGVDPTKIPRYIPRESSSSVIVGCHDPMCHWIFGHKLNCNGNRTVTGCPAYVVQYGSGSTAGRLISDSLDLPGRPVPRFLIGCSLLSIRQPSGIAGFGRGPQSLPSQLALSKFSHCLLSHRFDDSSVTSDLVLDGDEDGAGIQYTPFQDNPGKVGSPFKEYYYVMLRRIFVGGRRVKIPYMYLKPMDGDGGGGGTIVDSGSTFTFMEPAIRDVVAKEFTSQRKGYKRVYDVENRTGLLPCFDLSGENKSVSFPELVFQFKGGAKMEQPLSNYFSLVGDGDVACLTVVTSSGSGPELSGGPAIILGNYQQMNFHVEYDLKNNRFGFKRQNCITK